MFCKNCGTDIHEDRFCSQCGTENNSPADQPANGTVTAQNIQKKDSRGKTKKLEFVPVWTVLIVAAIICAFLYIKQQSNDITEKYGKDAKVWTGSQCTMVYASDSEVYLDDELIEPYSATEAEMYFYAGDDEFRFELNEATGDRARLYRYNVGTYSWDFYDDLRFKE